MTPRVALVTPKGSPARFVLGTTYGVAGAQALRLPSGEGVESTLRGEVGRIT